MYIERVCRRIEHFPIVGALALTLALSAVLLLATGRLSLGAETHAPAAPTSPTTLYSALASWAVTYKTVANLKAASDVVVAGRIGPTIRVTAPGPRNPAFTDYALAINKVVWDPKHLVASETITIHQTGGIIGHSRYEVTDDPLFHEGEQVVLFLHQFAPGQFYVVGGPTGRFRVERGFVIPVGDEGVTLPKPVSEDAFLAGIQ